MRILALFLLVLLSSFSLAKPIDMNDPNQVIHLVSVNTFARINRDKEKLATDQNHIKVIMEEELIPYFDYKYAAYKVLGPNINQTTELQRDNFVAVFKQYLINAYGHILYKYEQQEIEIQDNIYFKDNKIISIPVIIRDKNNQTTKIAFKLRKNSKTGEWKVFDVIAEGISMLDTKRTELNELIQEKGVEHVIELMQQKNSEF